MATSRRHRTGPARAGLGATPIGRHLGSWSHLAGCAAASGALVLGVVGDRTRPWIVLGALVAYTATATVVTGAGRLLRTRPHPGDLSAREAPDPRRVQELLYLNVRRVNDSLALLRESLAGERKVTGGATIDGGVEVRTDLLGAGLSGSRKHSIRQEIEEVHLAGDEERYRKLYDSVGVRAVPDASPATLQRQTFWEFRLTGVRPIEAAGDAYAVGRLDGTSLWVWLHLDPQWCREQPREFTGDLTVVARAAPERPPEQLIEPLERGSERPDWRLRPLAVLR